MVGWMDHSFDFEDTGSKKNVGIEKVNQFAFWN
jgi:hypothetical protein